MPPGRRVHVTELSQGQKALVVIGLAAVLMALVVLTLNHTARTREPAAVEVVAPAPQAAPVLVAVHVVGAVRQPGVYWLPEHSRVSEAVQLAGGLRPDADVASVNLAAYLQDGEQVKVSFAATAQPAPEAPRIAAAPPNTPAAPAAATPAAGTPAAGVPARRPGPSLDLTRLKPVSLSTGTAQELEALPGVGPQLATAIVQYRAGNGAFRNVDDLVKVPGFGPERVENIRPYVVP